LFRIIIFTHPAKQISPPIKEGFYINSPDFCYSSTTSAISSISEITIYQTVQHKKYLGLSSPIGTNMAMTVSLPWNKAPTKIPSKSAIKI
jgi:hypothetical protein